MASRCVSQVTDTHDVAGLRVLVMGLGHFGGGLGVTRWLANNGASVTVTDLSTGDRLADSLGKAADLDVVWHLGRHDTADLDQADLVVVNPAVDKARSEFFQAVISRGIPYTTEMNLFCGLCPAPIIGITGTYGKSTTCAMLADALQSCAGNGAVGYSRVHLGGNIGGSLLNDLSNIDPTDYVVLEMSSAQLEDLPMISWAPRIAAITNLSPHHLNRYDSYEAYVSAKSHIVGTHDRATSVIVGNLDARTQTLLRNAVPDYDALVVRVGDLQPPIELQIPGKHNRDNATCALGVCRQLALDETVVRRALQRFKGLPHRLEFVRTVEGVDYYNDSKATSPGAAIRAVEALDRPIVAIVGGRDITAHTPGGASDRVHPEPQRVASRSADDTSGQPVRELRTAGRQSTLADWACVVTARARAVICTGESASAYATALRTHNRGRSACAIRQASDLEDALRLARVHAYPGDIVLLSPGAPSFDHYSNFAARGQHFVDLVNAL
ncbi:MAG: UDP-N-acetylmuramoyl-L-alanine--D-glutamate ligase [Phycisphaerae bacterium]